MSQVGPEAEGSGTAKKKLKGLGPFAIMSLSYILFTTTDGGVRIIVLLHAYKQGFTALALAAIFSGYELAGMIVNLLAGMAGVSMSCKFCPILFLPENLHNCDELQGGIFGTWSEQ